VAEWSLDDKTSSYRDLFAGVKWRQDRDRISEVGAAVVWDRLIPKRHLHSEGPTLGPTGWGEAWGWLLWGQTERPQVEQRKESCLPVFLIGFYPTRVYHHLSWLLYALCSASRSSCPRRKYTLRE